MEPRISILPDSARVWAEVDLNAVRHNVAVLRGLLKHGAEFLAVVKSEAYGHGATPVAKAALAAGATRLGVNEVKEGAALRAAGINVPIQLLAPSLAEELSDGIEAGLTFAVSSADEIKLLADRSRAINQGAKRGKKTKVHLQSDTGMGRGGFRPEEVWPAAERVKAEKTLELEGIFTHFSSAEEDDPSHTQQQVKMFRKLLRYCEERGLRFPVRHAANSAGTVFFPDAQLDLVRCGVLLHGLRAWPAERDGLNLRPSLALYTRIVHIGRRPAGWTVGYNRRHVCSQESLLATLPVGYSEGYSRGLCGRGRVIIRSVPLPVVGAISMSQIVVDITPLENSSAGVPHVGEVATLIGVSGQERISVEELAEKGGTIPYVVTTQLGAGVERRYLGAEALPAQEPRYEMRPSAAPPVPLAQAQSRVMKPRRVASA